MTSPTELKAVSIARDNSSSKGIDILELAPGKGNLTRTLLDVGFQHIEALDIHPENFRVEGVTCHRGDLNEAPWPFPDERYDLVFALEVIEHLEHQYRFAAECARILKPDGKLILSTPNIDNFASRLRFFLTGFYSLATRPSSEFTKNWLIEHIYPLTFWQLRHILHTNGLFIKAISTSKLRRTAMIGLPLWPISYLMTLKALMKEPEPRQKEANKEITRQMNSLSLFLGKNQIVLAQKEPHDYVKDVGRLGFTPSFPE